jgi:hypothetical protein
MSRKKLLVQIKEIKFFKNSCLEYFFILNIHLKEAFSAKKLENSWHVSRKMLFRITLT